jgi:ornithine carbamoyltransferase
MDVEKNCFEKYIQEEEICKLQKQVRGYAVESVVIQNLLSCCVLSHCLPLAMQ